MGAERTLWRRVCIVLPCVAAVVGIVWFWQVVVVLHDLEVPSSRKLSILSRPGPMQERNDTAGDAARELLRIMGLQGRSLRVLQVGACDGAFEDSNDPMQALLVDGQVRALVVEPVPYLYTDLRKRLEQVAGGSDRLRALNAAVCTEEQASVPFYVVSKLYGEEHPDAPHWQKRQLGSFEKAHLRKHHIPRKYIETLLVPCTTPANLFNVSNSPIGADPARVDALIIDAEGLDGRLVQSFMAIPTFRPQLLIFERKHIPQDGRERVHQLLENIGYEQWPDKDQHIGVLAGTPLSDWARQLHGSRASALKQ